MSFGWSPSDIYTLVVVSYRLVENCREGVTSASLQIKALENELTEFTAVLYQLQKVLEDTKDIAFIDCNGIKETFDACSTYLSKYKHLQQTKLSPNTGGDPPTNSNADTPQRLRRRSSLSKSRELLDKSWETSLKFGQALKYSSWGGDQEMQLLQKKFARHRQTLGLYLQILERKRHAEDNSKLQKRLYNVEAMVKDLHSGRRLSSTGSPSIPPHTQRYQHQPENGHEDYEFIIQALNEQKRLALVETERADDDETLQEWNDILSHLEFIHRRVLNAAERTANFTAQRRTGSASYQISLNRMLTPRHTVGTTSPSLRPVGRVDTQDSGFFELPPVREESSGVTEGFVQSGTVPKPMTTSPEPVVENRVPLTPRSLLLKPRTMSVNGIERPAISPMSSSESVSVPPPSRSPRHSRTFSISSSEVSLPSALLYWELIQLNGWVKCSTSNCRKPMLCNLHAGRDSNGQVYALQVQKQNTNSSLLIMKLSTHRKRPIPHIEPSGERDIADEGILAYFIGKLDTEPKDEAVQFFFQDEKSLNIFENVVYGQELLLPMVIEKISSSNERLSDHQRIRVWKKGDNKSLLFFASKCEKSRRRYISIQAHDILPKTKLVKKNSLEFKLQSSNSAHLPDLKIVFKSRDDLDLFTAQFLPN